MIGLIFGITLVACGLLVKWCPGLIAGYNTMSKERKKNVDIDGLTSWMMKMLIGMGIALISVPYILKWTGTEAYTDTAMPVILIGGSLALFVGAQQFDHNKRSGRSFYASVVVLVVVVLAIVGLNVYTYRPTDVVIEGDRIRFTGIYGFETSVADVEKVALIDALPDIKLRTDGVSIGRIRKGNYRTHSGEACRLLINSKLPPYLMITRKNAPPIFLNHKDTAETRRLYEQLQEIEKNR